MTPRESFVQAAIWLKGKDDKMLCQAVIAFADERMETAHSSAGVHAGFPCLEACKKLERENLLQECGLRP